MLKIEDLKVGDELVCIDREGFLQDVDKNERWGSCKDHIVAAEGFTVKSIEYGCIFIEYDIEIYLQAEYLKYFKKKEQSQQYTFDDLIDVARKAFDDVVLQGYAVENKLVKSLSIKFSDTKVLTWHLGDDDYSIPIGHIKSLYKETFVIEEKEDCKRIKQNAKITFLNGNSVVMDQPPVGDGIVRIWNDGRYDFTVLKGATVEQERGRDDRS